MKKVSVIVPVYKVEEYLDRCVESIVKQTYKNLEIILVDDGSPDNCPKMCDDWAKKDDRIKVIHKENGGLSDARNAGLDVATGEYISFIDSDDFIHETMIEKLLNSAIENDSDIVKCMLSNIDENGNIEDMVELNLDKVDSKNIFYYYTVDDGYKQDNKIYTQYVSNSVCTSLYSSALLKGKRFVKDMFSEDLIFNCDVINEDCKISVVNENLYYYFYRTGSIMHTYNESKMIKRLVYIDAAIDRLKNKLEYKDFCAYKFQLYKQLVMDIIQLKDKSIYKKYKNEIRSRNLNSKENYNAYKKNYSSFRRKLLNFLIHKNMFVVLKLLYKIKK
ncbi:MAG: glycosyltransferase [Clostridia bacterium]|nr:glycosyltransferase [Clostridia bacterium]